MKKKYVIIAVITILLLCGLLFFGARYGWKLFGFSMCASPDVLTVESVSVTDNELYIKGDTSSSATKFAGYKYEMEDDVLYIGVRQDLFFGSTGAYELKIKDDFSDVKYVYLCGGDDKKLLWNRMQGIKELRLYKSVDADTVSDAEAAAAENEFEYADAEILDRIRSAEKTQVFTLSKGRHLGVAVFENGDVLYLSMENHYNYFFIIGEEGKYMY